MASGNGFEVAKAFVTIVPTMEGSQATITKELTGVTDSAATEAGESSGKKFGESLASGLKTTGAVIAGAMAAATGAAVALGKGFIDAANDVAQLGDTIDKESQKMNMSATGYQEWDFILQHAGTSIEGMKTSMKKLTLAAEEGNEAFAALGISEEELASMSPEETWNRTIAALQNVADEGERTALANDLLGKGAVELAPLFNMTAEETEELKNQVHDLGGVMSDEAVKDAAAYQDAMQNMNTALDGVKKNMMSNFLPGITQAMEGLAKVFSGDKSGIGQIKDGLKDVISNITELAPDFFNLASEIISALLEGFAPMLPQIVETLFSILIQAITVLTTMLPQMMPQIIAGIQGIVQALFQALPVIVQGLSDLILSVVTWLSEGNNVTNFVNGLVALVSQIADQFVTLLPVLIPALISIISELALALSSPDNVVTITNAVLSIVEAVVTTLINSLPQILELIWNLTVNITEGTFAFLGTLLVKLGEWIVSAVAKVAQFGVDIINKLKELPHKVIEIGQNLVRGLVEGIQNMASWVGEKLKQFGDSVVNGLKSFFGIASPSKLMADVVGRNMALGIAEGFGSEVDNVEKDIVDSMDGLTGNMTASVSAYATNSGSLSGNNTTYNGGNITINVYASEGQNVDSLANQIAVKLESMTKRRESVYA